MTYFNPRIPCGMRRSAYDNSDVDSWISIHASHAGCDGNTSGGKVDKRTNFNPRIPCGMRPENVRADVREVNFNPRIPCGMRLAVLPLALLYTLFQSTHPMRDATMGRQRKQQREGFQSTHPMRDATRRRNKHGSDRTISIHASHAGCDIFRSNVSCFICRFQSTHPMRDATWMDRHRTVIHK